MATTLRSLAKAGVPRVARQWASAYRLRAMRERNAQRSITEVFSEIYATGAWGAGDAFDSGSGSRGEAATRYASYIRELVRATGAQSVVDVGCGDFRVAAQFVDCLTSYRGIDVAPDVVGRNQSDFGGPGITFSLLDASADDLPEGDICLIRQVLQHLSNHEISNILRRCRAFPIVVVTEHWPAPSAASLPNLDKPHGPDTRLDLGSWVDVSRSPFNCAVQQVLSVAVDRPLYHSGETIRTHLWRPASVASDTAGDLPGA